MALVTWSGTPMNVNVPTCLPYRVHPASYSGLSPTRATQGKATQGKATQGKATQGTRTQGKAAQGTRIQSQPLVADVNHDGQSDVIVCMESSNGSTWLEAIAGPTGARHWRHHLGGASDSSDSEDAKPTRNEHRRLVDLITHQGQDLIVVEDESQICYYDLDSGLPTLTAFSPPGHRSQSTCFADFDGDGESEAILFRRHGTRELIAGYPPFSISAWQSIKGHRLWDRPFSCALAGHPHNSRLIPAVDLNQDQRVELAVANYVRSILSINMVDAMTGNSLWPEAHRLSRNPDASIGQVLESPDLNGDGIRDLVVVSLDQAKRGQSRRAVYVDLLSGRDGTSIASFCRELPGETRRTLVSAQWIPQPDRFPLLAVVTSKVTSKGQIAIENGKQIDVWSLPRRRLVAAVRDVDQYQACDLDGTGLVRLCVSRRGVFKPTLSFVSFHNQEAGWPDSYDPLDQASSYLAVIETRTLSAATDPRWLEPLPWSTMFDKLSRDTFKGIPNPIASRLQYLGIAQVTFLGIFFAPGWILCRSFVDRRWSLGRWLLLPVVVGIAIVSYSLLADNDQTKQIASLSGLPKPLTTLLIPLMSWTILLLPVELVVLMLRRKYLIACLLLTITTLSAVTIATIWLLPLWSRMDPRFSFDWDRWHWIWLAAAYITGWGYLLALGIFNWAHNLESRQSLR